RSLLANKIEAARKDYAGKDYAAAVRAADEVLQQDPQNADARQVRESAQGAMRQAEEAVKETRSALDAGQAPTASQALSRLLALDPRNPAAAELKARLDGVWRAQVETA